MYINGLTQTCAALRCRIAELESDNRHLQGTSQNLDPAQGPAAAAAAAAGKLAGAYGGGGVTGVVVGDAMVQDMMALMSPPAGVAAERGGGGTGGGLDRKAGGFTAGGRNSSPRARLSWMSGAPRRGSTTHRESDAFIAPAARTKLDEGATRRVSSIPNRARYSVGASRFSLPPNLSPPCHAIASPGGAAPEISPRNEPGSVWEGLMLTHPITGDEKNLAFMEFAVIGASPSTLAGSHPLQPWGQDAEVLSRFPSAEGKGPEGEQGRGDGSFVQGLGEFCFPSGASISLVEEGAAGTLDSVPEDRMHLVQFTDCENAATYGCCVTVTQVLQDPSPRLVKRLQERKKMHAAARTLQSFMRSARSSASGGDSAGHHCSTPTPEGVGGGGTSRFGFQTPPPGSGSAGGAIGPSNGQGYDLSPTSFSGMINRFFSSNPGAEIDTAFADNDGEVGRSELSAAAPMASGRVSSPPCSASVGEEKGSPVMCSGTAAVGRTGSPSLVSSRPPPPMTAASSPPRRRAPSSPCPKTQISADYPRGGDGQRARSAGYSGGGGGMRNDMIRAGNQGRSAGGESVPKNVPGMFSDDESESDAGPSSDTDRDDSFGGGLDNPAAAAAAAVRGHNSNSSIAMETEAGGRASGYIGAAGPFEGRDGLNGRKQLNSNGRSPIRGPGGAEAPTTPPGVTLRNRVASHPDVAAAAAAGEVVGGTDGGHVVVAATTEEPSWVVLVERCYVMVSCHRNHPLMFKVLKAIADADRSTRPGASASPSPPPSQPVGGTASITFGGRAGHGASLSPPRVRPGSGVGGGGSGSGDSIVRKGRSRSASRFRSVAAAAAEEAKGRHRRMLRDKFLHQVRTDKSCTEEGKKVSLHCPAYLRAPLEVASTALELWSTAVLFSCVSEQATLQALDVLLLEKTLVVCGRDLGMVSMAATALLSLLDPFKWEGVFVPVVPLTLMDVLDSPVPALVGVQAPFDPLSYALDGVNVLDLDARQSSGHLFMAGMGENLPVPEDVVSELKKANTLRGSRGRGAGAWAGRSPASRKWDSARGDSRYRKTHNASSASDWRVGGRGRRGRTGGVSASSPSSTGPRSHFAFQASTFMAGLTPEERGTVVRLRSLVKEHVSSLCGDLGVSEMWRKYGAFNSATKNFDFYPDWFTEPLEARLRFQVGVARTQMFVSFVERCRQRDSKMAEEDEGDEGGGQDQDQDQQPPQPADEQQRDQQPLAEPNANNNNNNNNNNNKNKGSRGESWLQGPRPPLSARHFQAPSEGAALPASVSVRLRDHRGHGEGRRREAAVTPPPLPNRGRV
eukprot:g13681.t1